MHKICNVSSACVDRTWLLREKNKNKLSIEIVFFVDKTKRNFVSDRNGQSNLESVRSVRNHLVDDMSR